jgi:hypothetical protein
MLFQVFSSVQKNKVNQNYKKKIVLFFHIIKKVIKKKKKKKKIFDHFYNFYRYLEIQKINRDFNKQ